MNTYWQRNLRLIVTLLVVWFTMPFLGGIVFVDFFNRFSLAGYPLGFWIAQQGSIYVFVVLIFIYAIQMDKLDQRYGQTKQDESGSGQGR